MLSNIFILYALIVCLSCTNSSHKSELAISSEIKSDLQNTIDNPFHSIGEIPVPAGYHRLANSPGSFAAWLSNTRLKKDKTVYLFNGKIKTNQLAQFAVLDVSVGTVNLQQCADAVMRLRAEYLYSQHRYADIRFTDNEHKIYAFTEPYSRKNFDTYLQRVFAMCGSASLAKQLKRIDFDLIEAGDVLIRGGFPGHAVIVMDIAVNDEGQKIFLLAQSYMPAQDIHVLINPVSTNLSPWYAVTNNESLLTPEYDFTRRELKRW